MARPLNRPSKIFGLFYVTDFLKLMALGFVDFILLLILTSSKILPLEGCLTVFLGVLFILVIYFFMKAALPDGFIPNLFRFSRSPQRFFPLPEPPELIPDLKEAHP